MTRRLSQPDKRKECPCGRVCKSGKRCSNRCQEKWPVSNVPFLKGKPADLTYSDFTRRAM